MTNLDRPLFQELVDLLTPYMGGEEERRTWLQLALGHTPLYHQINFRGPANTFTVQMITTLLNYGEVAPGVEALWALLDVLKTQVGGNRQQAIEQVQSKLSAFFPAQPGNAERTKPTGAGAPADPAPPATLPPVPGSIHFSGAAPQIDDDVIVGSVVYKTIFQGPVSGPIHTGSGEIQMQPATDSGSPEFTNIWYTPKKYGFFQLRNPDLGVLSIKDNQVTYTGDKQVLRIGALQAVIHTRMPGDVNNNWVQVDYGADDAPAVAYFACAKPLGIGFLVGGSEALYHALRALIH